MIESLHANGHARTLTGAIERIPAVSVSDERLAKIHAYAREKGVSRPLYALAKLLLTPLLRFWFRLHVEGVENVPAEGPAVVAPNHKSFLDAFFVGLAQKRHVRFMAKVELFNGPLGWMFPRLGAFPVRRGKSDADALETARTILRQGGLLVVFPEGTRVEDEDALGSPHHGAGRLAAETGAPMVPAAIAGTSRMWFGPIPKPRRVQVSFLEPIQVTDMESGREAVSELVNQRVWPRVQEEYGRLVATPGMIAAALAAAGIGGLLATRQRKKTQPRLLGVVAPGNVRRKQRRRRGSGRRRARRS
jgi:1-acyl-sn-glycerol-3-phosphate acyltransferase